MDRDAEIEALRAALKPFADMVEKFTGGVEGHPSWFGDELAVLMHPIGGSEHTMRLGDFRRAMTAMKPLVRLGEPTRIEAALAAYRRAAAIADDTALPDRKYQGFDLVDLANAFTAVCDPKDWREPIDAIMAEKDTKVTVAAINFYTATGATIEQRADGTARIKSVGYRAGPAGP